MTDRNKAYLNIISAYDSSIRKLYDNMIDELSKLAKSSYEFDADGKGVQFRFSDHKATQKAAERIIKKYTDLITTKINAGIKQAVNAAYAAEIARLNALNVKSDKLITEHRENAVAAFNEYRTQNSDGLSLSDRVWNYTSQTKSEFEMAMSQKIEDGLKRGASAEELGRGIKSMLKNPDAVYRRYHLKITSPDGTKRDKVEWRRRTVDADGKIHYTSTDIEKTGRGVYRSARQNALRLAATEINMAYRYADCQRWQNSPYVLGFEIRLSNNHPEDDMCDELKGRYPKDFIWTGWHPRCRCYAVAITVPYNEMRLMSKLPKAQYRNYKPHGLITDMPENFIKWMGENKERALAAIERGKPPYFIRDNAKYVNKPLGIKSAKTVHEIAKERHAMRTPEKEAMLRDYWQKKVEQGNIRRRREAILAAAEKRHALRTDSYMNDLQNRLAQRKKLQSELSKVQTIQINKVPLRIKNPTFVTDKEVKATLINFAKANPSLFNGGLVDVKIIREKSATAFMANSRQYYASTGAYAKSDGNTLKITNKDFTTASGDVFNPLHEVKGAMKAISEKTALTFNQEYALESIWHEFRHAAAVGWKDLRLKTTVLTHSMEVINQFCARHSYPNFIRGLGGKAIHAKKVMKKGYGYGQAVSNFNTLLKHMKVSQKAAYKHFQDIIIKSPYEDIHAELVKFVELRGKYDKKAAESIVCRLDYPSNDFKLLL